MLRGGWEHFTIECQLLPHSPTNICVFLGQVLFSLFERAFDNVVLSHKQKGTYDPGIVELTVRGWRRK